MDSSKVANTNIRRRRAPHSPTLLKLSKDKPGATSARKRYTAGKDSVLATAIEEGEPSVTTEDVATNKKYLAEISGLVDSTEVIEEEEMSEVDKLKAEIAATKAEVEVLRETIDGFGDRIELLEKRASEVDKVADVEPDVSEKAVDGIAVDALKESDDDIMPKPNNDTESLTEEILETETEQSKLRAQLASLKDLQGTLQTSTDSLDSSIKLAEGSDSVDFEDCVNLRSRLDKIRPILATFDEMSTIEGDE